jgi:hypothetical protein
MENLVNFFILDEILVAITNLIMIKHEKPLISITIMRAHFFLFHKELMENGSVLLQDQAR